MADPISPSTTTIKVKVDGKELDEDDIVSVEVQADLNQPDMVDLCLSNLGEAGQSGGKAKRHSSTFKAGATLEVLMGQAGSVKRVFLGRVIGCVPTYDTHHAGHVSVHGMNDLHNLARERRTRTFCNNGHSLITKRTADGAKIMEKQKTMNKIIEFLCVI